jgi:hypothetical protein
MSNTEFRASAQLRFTESRIRHLEMIQEVIQRMSNHSAHTKQLALTMVVATGTVAAISEQSTVLYAVVLLLFSFAWINASYLRVERRFRSLYDAVRQEPATTPPDFRLTPCEDGYTVIHTAKCFASWSNAIFYGSAALCVLLLALILE